jgi:hypothetical protein
MKLINVFLAIFLLNSSSILAKQAKILNQTDQEHGVLIDYLDNKGNNFYIPLLMTDLDDNEQPHVAYLEDNLLMLQRFHPAEIQHKYKKEAYLPYKNDGFILFSVLSNEDKNDSLFPHDTVDIFNCCFSANYSKEIKDIEALNLYRNFTDYSKILEKDAEKITIYDAIILSQNVKKDTLRINNYAYTLYSKNEFLYAGIILKSIVENDPDRTVALLNYADVIWKNYSNNPSLQSKAIPFYKKYKNNMIKENKEHLIPSYINQRLQFIENIYNAENT